MHTMHMSLSYSPLAIDIRSNIVNFTTTKKDYNENLMGHATNTVSEDGKVNKQYAHLSAILCTGKKLHKDSCLVMLAQTIAEILN